MTFYHGTRRGFTRGGVLLPRSKHGGAGTTAPVNPGMRQPQDASSYVYVTTDVAIAWVYAWHAAGRGKPKVLVVQPIGEVKPDPEHSPAMSAYRCEWARVESVLTEPTITEQQAREGWED